MAAKKARKKASPRNKLKKIAARRGPKETPIGLLRLRKAQLRELFVEIQETREIFVSEAVRLIANFADDAKEIKENLKQAIEDLEEVTHSEEEPEQT